PMSKILGMLPGAGQFKQAINEIDEKEIDRIEAIIYSMTPAERDDVSILNGSRRARIAKGAGVQVSEVNKLVNRFVEARKMMEAMAGGGMPGMPGMPGMGGGRRAGSKKPVTSKRKGKKPAPRPQQRRPQQGQQQPAAPQIPQTMDDFQLPPELQKMFDENKPKF
ncbi:MAG TPA: signal recognition particle protein, partial [Arachnia sp.]|nr:signal recognition particle protein [Arachnia sp.]